MAKAGKPEWQDWRWIILLLNCCVLLGPYAAYDNPGATESALRTHMQDKGLSPESTFDTSYSLLYSVYAIPNTVLPIIGGLLTDRVSPTAMLIVLSATQLLGQLLFAAGASTSSWYLMLAGRATFGIGGEVLTVANNWLAARWFSKRETATALAVIVGFGRACSVFNDGVSPLFTDVAAAYWFSGGLCALSTVGAVCLAIIDRKRTAAIAEEEAEDAAAAAAAAAGGDEEKGAVGFGRAGERHTGKHGALGASVRPADLSLTGGDETSHSATPPSCCVDVMSSVRHGIQQLTGTFWLLAAAWVVGACSVSSYNNVATDYLTFRWGITQPESASNQRKGLTLGIIYLVAAIASPIIGRLIDWRGARWPFALSGMLLAASCHTLLGVPDLWVVPVEFVHSVLGIAYALTAAASWSLVPLLVPVKASGTAYGVATAVQNIGLALFPLAVAGLQPGSKASLGGAIVGACSSLAEALGRDWGYFCSEALLATMAVVAAILYACLACSEVSVVARFASKRPDKPRISGTSEKDIAAAAPLLE
jgi:MFS family permease